MKDSILILIDLSIIKMDKKQIKILNSKGLDDFLKNIEFYVDIFLCMCI